MIAEPNADGKNRKDTDMATNAREARSVACGTLEQTSFELYRSEFVSTIARIRAMRLMEHLGRYTSRATKDSKVAEFHSSFLKVLEALELMKVESEAYKALLLSQDLNRLQPAGSSASTRQQREQENQFRQRTIKSIKDCESLWVEVFEEGSLKRLIPVLMMLRMEDYDMAMHYNIVEWARCVQANLSVTLRKKAKGLGCCF